MLFVGSDGQILVLSAILLHASEVWGGLACLSNPCIHGVCLDDLNSTYFCYCIDGYTGIQCQTNWNECWSAPCQNGGICIDGVASFNCSCPPGFVGDLCEVDFNECESNPCLNNGTCQDDTNGYFCNCPPGYSGTHCEIDVAVCNATNETRCANGGFCVEGPGDSFSCNCQPGWARPLCELEIDECMSSPCQNGAVCINLLADYSCACLFGFTGRNCEENVELCDKNPCRNGAICLLEDQHPVCYCVPDFHGELCQFQYDECQLRPKCLNGGTCVDGIDNSSCSCPPNLTGVRCECLILDENVLDCTYVSPEPIPTTSTQSTTTPLMISTTMETEVPNVTSPETYSTTTTFIWTSTIDFTTFSTEYDRTTSTQFSTEETTLVPSTTPMETTIELVDTTTITTESTMQPEETTLSTYFSTSTQFPVTSTFYSSPWTEFTTETTEYSTFSTMPATLSTSPRGREMNMSSTSEDTTIFSSSITTFFTNEPDATTGQMDLYTDMSTEEATDGTVIPPLPFDCSKTSCQNGGTCVYASEGGYHCECPFDTEGRMCEVKLGIQKVAFTGQSYLKHSLPSSPNVSIEFQAKTLAMSGVLFYSHVDTTYMVLYIENGHLKFKFSCGYQTMLLSELKIPVNNGFLMKVKAKLEFSKDLRRCDAAININDTLSMTGDQIASIDQFSKPIVWLFLGSVPQELGNANVPDGGFVGCMLKLKISGKSVDIFKDAEDGFGVTECSSLACLSNPCSNGATCYSKGEEWTCSCKNGFLGKMCEKSVCDDNPCLFGGTCVPFSGSGYICLCPFGKHGHFCENDLKVTEPHFSSTIRGLSSYVAYPIPSGISETMEIKFRFLPSTMDQIAILMFMGQKGQHDFYSDHMAVSFVKGYIMLTWNLGSGPRRIFTSLPIEAGANDYEVRIGRLGRRAWLYVANLGNVTGRSPGNLVQLDVAPILYIGGHEAKNFSTLPHDLPLHTGFSGCIFDIEIISGNLVIPLQGSRQTAGRSVGQCGTTECYEQMCQNGGVCLRHASTFMCLCQDGWFGPLCSFRRNPCDSTIQQCATGATCVPTLSDYECDCPIGKTGKFCQKDEDITDVYFTGTRSYLALFSVEFETSRFNVEMEIRPLNDNGLLFFVEKADVSFVSLSLQSGLLELKILTSRIKIPTSDPSTITSTRMVIKGIWYKVQFGVYGKKAYLSVDNVINSAVLPTEFGVNLSRENIFIGGLPDMSYLPLASLSRLPTAYRGCVRHFSINSIQIPLIPQNILHGRNMNDCDGTPCGKDACLNGGTCWLDSFMKPHCSCLLPFYGNKCERTAACEEKTCGDFGKCDNEKCSCNVGWTGAFCQDEIRVTTPEFSGKSYLVVGKSSEKKRQTPGVALKSLYLNFTTVKKDGLVLWSKNANSFVGLGLENGFLKMVYNDKTNKTFVNLPFYHKIADGLWHNIEIAFTPFSMKLDQNKTLYKGKYKDALETTTIATDGLFYIGGIPTKSTIWEETNGTFFDAFEGCIEGFATNGGKIIRDFTQFQGRDINICKIL